MGSLLTTIRGLTKEQRLMLFTGSLRKMSQLSCLNTDVQIKNSLIC